MSGVSELCPVYREQRLVLINGEPRHATCEVNAWPFAAEHALLIVNEAGRVSVESEPIKALSIARADPEAPWEVRERGKSRLWIETRPCDRPARAAFRAPPMPDHIEPLGSGGMGVVWRALDLRDSAVRGRDLEVALKLLPSGVRASALEYQRLQREALRARALNHPHIVNVYDWHEDPGGLVFLAMEYLQGRDLDQLLTGYTPWPSEVAALCHPGAPWPDAPEALRAEQWEALKTGLAYQPEARPKSCRELLAQLQRVEPAKPKPKPPPSPLRQRPNAVRPQRLDARSGSARSRQSASASRPPSTGT